MMCAGRVFQRPAGCDEALPQTDTCKTVSDPDSPLRYWKEDSMYRPRLTLLAVSVPALLMLAAFTGACASPPEEPLLRQFFRASQLRDNSTLANFSAATFDPRTDGVVRSFDILSVTEERRVPLKLKELARFHENARTADGEFSKRMKAYQDANLDAIERVLKAESAKKPISGRDAAVQAAWRKWRDDAGVSAKAVSEARAKLNADRPVAELSVQQNTGDPIDVTAVDGELVSKDVTIDAQVRAPSGESTQRQLVITIERAVLNVPGRAEPLAGRWIITKIDKG